MVRAEHEPSRSHLPVPSKKAATCNGRSNLAPSHKLFWHRTSRVEQLGQVQGTNKLNKPKTEGFEGTPVREVGHVPTHDLKRLDGVLDGGSPLCGGKVQRDCIVNIGVDGGHLMGQDSCGFDCE